MAHSGGRYVWVAESASEATNTGTVYVALFNNGEKEALVSATVAQRPHCSETAQGQLAERIHGVEASMGPHEAAIKDAQAKLDVISRRGVDPMARGADRWSTGGGWLHRTLCAGTVRHVR